MSIFKAGWSNRPPIFMMVPPNIHALNSTLLALPVALVLTRRLLLDYKSPALVGAGSAAVKPASIHRHPASLMDKLKNITGYSHYGLNE